MHCVCSSGCLSAIVSGSGSRNETSIVTGSQTVTATWSCAWSSCLASSETATSIFPSSRSDRVICDPHPGFVRGRLGRPSGGSECCHLRVRTSLGVWMIEVTRCPFYDASTVELHRETVNQGSWCRFKLDGSAPRDATD